MLQKLAHPFISYSLVIGQLACIFALLELEPWFSANLWLLLQFMGVGLGLWAVTTMHLGRFNIVPDPMPDAQLVMKGPYRWIRHPMYSSLLYFFFPIAVQSQNPITWLCYGLLLVDLVLKLHYEERLLKQKFTNYPDYQTKSKKLIPYLF
ncbi:methyltransferase family protein [Hydrogenovibrio marinus]|uniref:Isoprenylcysteine carboxyl methyltransferase n=1 Tax=Hydrogenovibrio marinus TaxID=28885 RepID=A0A066ZZP8_HYDMR|nr:isoprenylcysteine carboxylmethyltransferase family protein [Hydrogenovibrio marinus]KDN95585.1 hypothetical protein EI16_04590 [Hydrogenovibrio marinus]BBN60078.1 isoprenylcysteine carboxyl methyltransferase [Hydrogenovibrio marinus]